MPDYILREISTGFVETVFVWDGTIEEWNTSSGYTIEEITTSSMFTTGSFFTGSYNFQYSPNSFVSSNDIKEMTYSGSFSGSFNNYSGSLDWLDSFVSSSRSGSFTGSFTGSLQGTASYSPTASYITTLKSGKVTSGEWVVELVGNNYTASVLLSSSYLNSSYAVSLTCGADVRTLSVTNKTPSGFNINSNSTSAMTDDVYWVTIPYNNP